MTSVIKSDNLKKCSKNQNDPPKERRSTLPILKEKKTRNSPRNQNQENCKRVRRQMISETKPKTESKLKETDSTGTIEALIITPDSESLISEERVTITALDEIQCDKIQNIQDDDDEKSCIQITKAEGATKPNSSTMITQPQTSKRCATDLKSKTMLGTTGNKNSVSKQNKDKNASAKLSTKSDDRKQSVSSSTSSGTRSSKSRSVTPPSMSASIPSKCGREGNNEDQTKLKKRNVKYDTGFKSKPTSKDKSVITSNVLDRQTIKTKCDDKLINDNSEEKPTKTVLKSGDRTKRQIPVKSTTTPITAKTGGLNKGSKIAAPQQTVVKSDANKISVTNDIGKKPTVSGKISCSTKMSKSRSKTPPLLPPPTKSISLDYNDTETKHQASDSGGKQLANTKTGYKTGSENKEAKSDNKQKQLKEVQDNDETNDNHRVNGKGHSLSAVNKSKQTVQSSTKSSNSKQTRVSVVNKTKTLPKPTLELNKEKTNFSRQITSKLTVKSGDQAGNLGKQRSVSNISRNSKSRSRTPPSMSSSTSSSSSKHEEATKQLSKHQLVKNDDMCAKSVRNKISTVRNTKPASKTTLTKTGADLRRSKSKTPGSSSTSSESNQSVKSTSTVTKSKNETKGKMTSTNSNAHDKYPDLNLKLELLSKPKCVMSTNQVLKSESKLKNGIKPYATMSYMKTTQSAINKNSKNIKTGLSPEESKTTTLKLSPDNELQQKLSSNKNTKETKLILSPQQSKENDLIVPKKVSVAKKQSNLHLKSPNREEKSIKKETKSSCKTVREKSLPSVNSLEPRDTVVSQLSNTSIPCIKRTLVGNTITESAEKNKSATSKPIQKAHKEQHSSNTNDNETISKQSSPSHKNGVVLSVGNSRRDIISNSSSTLPVNTQEASTGTGKQCTQSQYLSKSTVSEKKERKSRLIAPLASKVTDRLSKVPKTNPRFTSNKSEKVSKLKPGKIGLMRSELSAEKTSPQLDKNEEKKNTELESLLNRNEKRLFEKDSEGLKVSENINNSFNDRIKEDTLISDTCMLGNSDSSSEIDLNKVSSMNVTACTGMPKGGMFVKDKLCAEHDQTLQSHNVESNDNSTSVKLLNMSCERNISTKLSTEPLQGNSYIGLLNEDKSVSMETGSADASAAVGIDIQINDQHCSGMNNPNTKVNNNCLSLPAGSSSEKDVHVSEHSCDNKQNGANQNKKSCSDSKVLCDDNVFECKLNNSGRSVASILECSSASLNQNNDSGVDIVCRSDSQYMMDGSLEIDYRTEDDSRDTLVIATHKESVEVESGQSTQCNLEEIDKANDLTGLRDRVCHTIPVGEFVNNLGDQNSTRVCQHTDGDVASTTSDTVAYSARNECTQVDPENVNTHNFKNVSMCQNDKLRINSDIFSMNEIQGLDSNSLRKLPNDEGCVSKQVDSGIDKTECITAHSTGARDTQNGDKRQNETELSTFNSVLFRDRTFDCSMTQENHNETDYVCREYRIEDKQHKHDNRKYIHTGNRSLTEMELNKKSEIKTMNIQEIGESHCQVNGAECETDTDQTVDALPKHIINADFKITQTVLSECNKLNLHADTGNDIGDIYDETIIQRSFTSEKSELSDWQKSVISDRTKSKSNEETQQVLRYQINKANSLSQNNTVQNQCCTGMDESSLFESMKFNNNSNDKRKLSNELLFSGRDTGLSQALDMGPENTMEITQDIDFCDSNDTVLISSTSDTKQYGENLRQVDLQRIETDILEIHHCSQNSSKGTACSIQGREESCSEIYQLGTKDVKVIIQGNDDDAKCLSVSLTQVISNSDPQNSGGDAETLVSSNHDIPIIKDFNCGVQSAAPISDDHDHALETGGLFKNSEFTPQVNSSDFSIFNRYSVNQLLKDDSFLTCMEKASDNERTPSFMLAKSIDEIEMLTVEYCACDSNDNNSVGPTLESSNNTYQDGHIFMTDTEKLESLKTVNVGSQDNLSIEISNTALNLSSNQHTPLSSLHTESYNDTQLDAVPLILQERDASIVRLPSDRDQTRYDTTNLIHVSMPQDQALNSGDDALPTSTKITDARNFNIRTLSGETALKNEKGTFQADIMQCDGTSLIKTDSDSIYQNEVLKRHQINDLSMNRDVHEDTPDYLSPARDPARDHSASPDMCFIHTGEPTSNGNHKKLNLNTNQDLFEDQMSSLSTVNITTQKSSCNQVVSENSSQPGDFTLRDSEPHNLEGYENYLTCVDHVDTCNSTSDEGKNTGINESKRDAEINSQNIFKKGKNVTSEENICICSENQLSDQQKNHTYVCVKGNLKHVSESGFLKGGDKGEQIENKEQTESIEKINTSVVSECSVYAKDNKGNDDLSVRESYSSFVCVDSRANALKTCGLDKDSLDISSKTDTYLKDNLITAETCDNTTCDICSDTLIRASEVGATDDCLTNLPSNGGNILVSAIECSSGEPVSADLCDTSDDDLKANDIVSEKIECPDGNTVAVLLDNKDALYHQKINKEACYDCNLQTKKDRQKFVKICDTGNLNQSEIVPIAISSDIESKELQKDCQSLISCESSATLINSILINAGEALCDNASIADVDELYDDICDDFVDAEETIISDSEYVIETNSTPSGLRALNKSGNASLYSSGDVDTSIESFQDAVETLDDDYLTKSNVKESEIIPNNEDDLSQISLPLSDFSSDVDTSLENLDGWEEFADDIDCNEDMEFPRRRGVTIQSNSVSSSSTRHVHTSQYRTTSVLKDNQYLKTAPSASYTDRQSEIQTNVFRSTDTKYDSGQQVIKNVIYKTRDGSLPENHTVQGSAGEACTSGGFESKYFHDITGADRTPSEGIHNKSHKVNGSQLLSNEYNSEENGEQRHSSAVQSTEQSTEHDIQDGELYSTTWCNTKSCSTSSNITTVVKQQEKSEETQSKMTELQSPTSVSTESFKTSSDITVTSHATSNVGMKIETAVFKRTERRRRRQIQKQMISSSSSNENNLNETCLRTEISNIKKVCENTDSRDNVVICDNLGTTSENSSLISTGSHTVTSINEPASVYIAFTGESRKLSKLNESHLDPCTNDKVSESSGSISISSSRQKEITEITSDNACHVNSLLNKRKPLDNVSLHGETNILKDNECRFNRNKSIIEHKLLHSHVKNETNIKENVINADGAEKIERVNSGEGQTFTFSIQTLPKSTEPDLDDIEFIDADDAIVPSCDISNQYTATDVTRTISPLEDIKCNDDKNDKSAPSPNASFTITFEIPSEDESSITCVTSDHDETYTATCSGESKQMHQESETIYPEVESEKRKEPYVVKHKDVHVDCMKPEIDSTSVSADRTSVELHHRQSNTEVGSTSICKDDVCLNGDNLNNSRLDANKSDNIETGIFISEDGHKCTDKADNRDRTYGNKSGTTEESSEVTTENLSENMNTEISEESNISVAHALQIEKRIINTVSGESSDLRKQGRMGLKGIRRTSLDSSTEKVGYCETKAHELAVTQDMHLTPNRKGVKKSKSFRIDRENVYSPDDDEANQNTETAQLISKTVSDICRSFLTKTRSAARVTKEKEAVISPTPQRKLMKWVIDNGKWLRIPINESHLTSNADDVKVEKTDSSNILPNERTESQFNKSKFKDQSEQKLDKDDRKISPLTSEHNQHMVNTLIENKISDVKVIIETPIVEIYSKSASESNHENGSSAQDEKQTTTSENEIVSTDELTVKLKEIDKKEPEQNNNDNITETETQCSVYVDENTEIKTVSEETGFISTADVIQKSQDKYELKHVGNIEQIKDMKNIQNAIEVDPLSKSNNTKGNSDMIDGCYTKPVSDPKVRCDMVEQYIITATNDIQNEKISREDGVTGEVTNIEEHTKIQKHSHTEKVKDENTFLKEKNVPISSIPQGNECVGDKSELSENSSTTQLHRRDFLLGLRDNYNRKKPIKLLPGRKPTMQDKEKQTSMEYENIKHKMNENTTGNIAETPRSIPKLKAVKIQEEIFEGRPEYMKECNKTPLGIENKSLPDDTVLHKDATKCDDSSVPNEDKIQLNIDKTVLPNKQFLLKKSKTFSGLTNIKEDYQDDTHIRFQIGGEQMPTANENREEKSVSHDDHNKKTDQSEISKLKETKQQDEISMSKYRPMSELGIYKESEFETEPTITCRPDKKRLKLPIVTRADRPKTLQTLQRNQLLSEIAEVEENKDDLPQTFNNHTQHSSSSVDKQEPKFRKPGRRGNKRRSLSLPTGSLAFGDARIVYKNGHFTIETMDGSEIDSSRPPDDYHRSQRDVNNMHVAPALTSSGEVSKKCSRETTPLKNDSREVTNKPSQMKRQCGRTVLNKNDSAVENGDVFSSDVNDIENISPNSNYSNSSTKRVPKAGYQDSLNESNSSRTSEMSYGSSLSETMDVDTDVESLNGKDPVCQSLSSSSLPESSDPEVKRVAQRARRTSSFRQAQEAGSVRLSGIQEDKTSDVTRKRTASLDESQNSDLNKSSVQQNTNSTFFQKMMAKRKSLNDNLNISSFTKQSESAKEFFAKKMTLKGLFKKNKSDSAVGSPMRTQHPVSPPIAAFQGDDDIGSIDTPPGSPYTNREFRRRHTSADIYIKSFADANETDSNCPTPTQERSSFAKQPSSSPCTPSHESHTILSFTSNCATPVRDEDQMSVTSASSASSSIHSVQSPPLEQPHKPKTPKPVGASPRRNPSIGSQMSRTSSLSRASQRDHSVTSLESENFEFGSQEYICECGHKTQASRQRKFSDNRGSSDSLTLCNYCKNSVDFNYGDSAVFTSSDLVRKHSLTSKQNQSEVSAKHRKDSARRTSYEKLGIISQADVVSSNSNDSGIQRDVSVHSSDESIKGIPESQVKLRRQKSTSPQPERPKSEVGVRWADLDTNEYEVEVTPVKFRHRDHGRDRPRPKSDLEDNIQLFDELFEEVLEDFDTEGSSFLSDRMKAFGSETNLQPYCSLRNLYEMRRQDLDKQNKNRRMSTPHPIKSRMQRSPRKLQKQPPLVRSSSMPESLEKIHKRRKLHHLLDFHLDSLSRHMDMDDCMSDDSDLSFDHISLQEKSLSVQSSHSQLTSMEEEEDNLTYAEALWDHITMDPEELGFRAQDVIEVVDMSDKDWWFGVIEDREGWFPAAFVRLRVNQDQLEDELDLDVTLQENLTTSPKLRRISMLNKNQARTNVVNEIINAEREYVKHLKDVVEGYIIHARKRKEMFSEERISLIFGNIETIYLFACKFLAQLETCIDVCPHLSEIGQCFLDNERGYEIYSDYCNNHPSACSELKELCHDSKYKHFFEACRLLQDLVEIPLEGFLLTPVQKICKYPLQLAELLKYTPPDHPDYEKVRDALSAMRKIATLINERKRKMESIEKIAAWQHSVVDWEDSDLLERSSELIFSGELSKINTAGWSQERYFFLFDHQLIYCKKELLKRHVFSYKGRIDLDHCDVVNVPDGKDVQYNVTVKHGWKLHETHRDKWYLMYAKTEAVKERWLKALQDERKRVREDQENDFCVPDHWKQTVLNKVRSQSNMKDKHHTNRAVHTTQHTFQKDLKDFPYSTLPRRRGNGQKQEKKKGWSLFGGGKKSKR